jgi:hypothetical protein
MSTRAGLRPIGMVPADARAEVVLMCAGAEVASWPLVCGRVDLEVVDDLSRLQLEARRQGCTIWLRHACPELTALLRFVGLGDVIAVGLQVGREPERLEEAGVEEVVVPDDPVT